MQRISNPIMTSTTTIIKVLQVNLNHCWLAHQLLAQTTLERGTDVALISDFHHRIGDDQHWIQSLDGKCVINVCKNSGVMPCEKGAGISFAWARISTIIFYSCYCTPNCTIQEFDQFLWGLVTSIHGQNLQTHDVIIGGDFNSHCTPLSGDQPPMTQGALCYPVLPPHSTSSTSTRARRQRTTE